MRLQPEWGQGTGCSVGCEGSESQRHGWRGWVEVPGAWGRDLPWRGDKGKKEEGGLWLGPWLAASGFFLFPKEVFRDQGSQPLDGGEGGGTGSVPKALPACSGSWQPPWGPGGGSIPAHRWGAPGPARLRNPAQGRQFIVAEFRVHH